MYIWLVEQQQIAQFPLVDTVGIVGNHRQLI